MGLKKLLFSAVAGCALAISLTSAAQAGITVYASVGGAPGGSVHDNLDALGLGNAAQVSAKGIQITFSGTGQVVSGSLGGVYAAPVLSGTNGSGFGNPSGDQATGIDSTNYLSAGGTSSPPNNPGVTLVFPEQLNSVGLLWGSIDTYNTLELLEGSTVVGTVTGSDAAAAASTLPNGDQGTDGTAYVNISSTDEFDTIEAFSSSYAFEFDDISYSANAIPTPEPLTLSLFGAGLVGAAALRRRRQKRA
jgi:hypothetical protein